MPDIGVVVGQFLRLRGDGVGDLLAAVADIDAIETGEGIEAFAAADIGDVDAFAASYHPCRGLAARMHAHMRGGVEEMVAVPGGAFVREIKHLGNSC